MLVLIVVAAVTAFSFYVATVEQSNLAQRTALHDKNLENVTVGGVVFTSAGNNSSITLDLSSSDIYQTYITGVSVDGNPAESYCNQTLCAFNRTVPFPVFNSTNGSIMSLGQFSVTPVTLYNMQFYIPGFAPTSTSSLLISIGTTRGNEFQDTLFPPVSKAGIQFVDGYPVLDGSGSYQPHEGTFVNATLIQWNWTVKNTTVPTTPPAADNGSYFGQEAELPTYFSPGVTYDITLTTTNSLGLSNTITVTYTAPGP